MLGKYTPFLWNSFCIFLIAISIIWIKPYVKNNQEKPFKDKEQFSIDHIGTNSTLWKRSTSESFLTIKENNASSTVGKEPKHSSDSWISMTWRRQ
jgi:hypothetical protein